ncbi:MAG: NYN domain-containing protein [Chloroflexi bacterium]|nr:NYN domain-containing protein [Chloroflexota bacterium]
MPYLIDGHNVIGQMTSLQLDDPHDEAKLVLLLRSYSAQLGTKFHVVFDGGIPSGMSSLSTTRVKVYFASVESSADNAMRMLIKNITNAGSWMVVSSDHAIGSTAKRKGMKVMRAERFAEKLESMQDLAEKAQLENYVPETKTEPRLSREEVNEWLDIFDSED